MNYSYAMNYTPIHGAYLQEIRDCSNLFIFQQNPSWRTTLFSIKKLGIIPYKYQHLLWKHFHTDQRVIVCKSRQIGISTAIEIFCLEAATENLYPSGILKNTKIGVMADSDEHAKKILLDIRDIIELSDNRNENTFFKDQTSEPDNVYRISFKNKSYIKSFPPTKKIRSYPLDIVFVDEAAYIQDDDLFHTAVEPTVSKTGGKIILVSTPNGQKGYFFEIFDPFDKLKIHEYSRFWFHWKQCEDELQKKIIRQKYQIALQDGNLKKFEQEENAMFTVDESAFFDSADVDNGVDKTLAIEYEWYKTPCVLAIDYGMSRTETTLTIKTKFRGKIITLFQWGKIDFDLNLLLDESFEHCIQNLMKRYHLSLMIVDDCPEGYQCNQQFESKGYPVRRFDFKGGGKNRIFYMYKSALKKGIIKYPLIRELIIQMKQLMEVKMKMTNSIEKPKSGLDDRIVGEVLASLPFIEEEGNFESILIESKPLATKGQFTVVHRIDTQWDELKASSIDMATLVAEHNRKILEKNARE